MANLHDSHLLPSALYKILKAPSLKNPNPVVVTAGGAATSSLEARQFLLCGACEDRFSQGGEQWILANCARPDGSFSLHKHLTAVASILASPDGAIHRADVSHVDPEKILYFATSIIWRAGATGWRNWEGRLKLGPDEEEQLRLYLLGKAMFPADAVLSVVISTPSEAKLMATFPLRRRIMEKPAYAFLMPGMLFTLILAKDIPDEAKRVVISSPSTKVILVSNPTYTDWVTKIGRHLRSIEPKGALRNFLRGPDPRRA